MSVINTESENRLVMELAGKTYILKIQDIDTELDVDQIVKIDYSNIMGELLTFAVIKNRIGLLRSEAESLLAEAKMGLEMTKANLFLKYRKSLSVDSKGVAIKPPTEATIDAHVLLDDDYAEAKLGVINAQRGYSILDSVYWSCNEKSEKLKLISDKMKPEDFIFELLTESINGVMISQGKKAI